MATAMAMTKAGHRSPAMANEILPKPNELLALHSVTTEMFDTLRRWFGVPPLISLNLEAIDSAVTEMADPVLIAAMAMRKLQALNLLSTPGVRTTTDVIVTIVQDLDRALVQAPNMRLNVAAEQTDWDAALVALETAESDGVDTTAGSPSVDDDDPEATYFREMHAKLHEAMFAVLQASDHEVRYFE